MTVNVKEFPSQNTALSIIDDVNIQQVSATMQKISQFQTIVQKTLKQNHDFGVIPGTPKPTLLKPGAEKILMLMGLTSEYDIVEKIEDYEKAIFAYTVKCTLYKNNLKITEGFGSCNSKEDKYRWRWVYESELPPGIDKTALKQKAYGDTIKYRIENDDICSQANTILKMAKKRAQIDATLTVAALSEIFTQDLEDMDIQGNPTENTYTPKVDNPGDVIVTFGKHKGKKLSEIPTDYIKWLAEKANNESLRDAARKFLSSENDEAPFDIPDDFPGNDEFPWEEEPPLQTPSKNSTTLDKASDSQMKAIFATAKEMGVTEEDELKAWISTKIKRTITSMKDLTKAEASTVISELNKMKAPAAQ